MDKKAQPSRVSDLISEILTPLLTDQYQYTMVYAYWVNRRHDEEAFFDLYFRKNPFKAQVDSFT